MLMLLAYATLCSAANMDALVQETSSPNAVCTTAQNTAKTEASQADLDCGNTHCASIGNAADEQKCICEHCATVQSDAMKASCACGLSDTNSKQSCEIYKGLVLQCAKASASTLKVGLTSIFLVAM